MKRHMAWGAVSVLLLTITCFSVMADDFDLSYVRGNNSYTIDVDQESGVAFIESNLNTSSRAFHHKYESNFYYSSTKWDMLIIDYFKSNPYPVLRLWITYSADRFLNATAVSMDLDGKRYTFTSIGEPDLNSKEEDGVFENLLIRFGAENADFILAMMSYIKAHSDAIFDESRRWSEIKIPVKIYGSETIETEFDVAFITDAMLIINAWYKCNGIQHMGKTVSTSMKVSDIP